MLNSIAQDIRFAMRGFRRNPGFTAIAAVTVALGIGANTAVFSVVNAVVLRPLPYRDPSRLVLVWTDDVRRGLHTEQTAYRTIVEWRQTNHTFDDIAFYDTHRNTLNDFGHRQRTRAASVSSNFFGLLGVAPTRGRVLSAADETARQAVAVISYSLWQQRFAGDSNIVGRVLRVESAGTEGAATRGVDEIPVVEYRIIGVMPSEFSFPDRQTEVWILGTVDRGFQRESGDFFAQSARRWIAIGRLRTGATIEDARRDLANVGRRLELTFRGTVPGFPGFAVNVVSLLDSVAGRNVQSALWLLLGAVSLVLAVACANVAGLLLARSASRRREFAVRRAIGASRWRLVQQLVVESVVLALIGGVVGVALAVAGTGAISAAAATALPRAEGIHVDARVLGVAIVVSITAGVLFGVIPAVRASGTDESVALKEGGRGSVGRSGTEPRGLLVLGECALAIVLLAGAGLLIRSLQRVQSVDPGFDLRGLVTLRIEFPPQPIPSTEDLHDLVDRVANVTGVDAVGFIDDMFVSGQGHAAILIPGRPDTINTTQLNNALVTPGFFRTMRPVLLRGRYLTDGDARPPVRGVVVNAALVRQFFSTEDPIGKHFSVGSGNDAASYEIVGVIADMHRQGLARSTIPEYFAPYVPVPGGRVDLMVRAASGVDPSRLVPSLRWLVRVTLPGAILVSVSAADQQLGQFEAGRVLQTWLFGAFAALALVLAAIGVYGVVHYGVAERRREIGVRMALGATTADILRVVIAQGMRLPLAGIAIGTLSALALTRLMKHLLFATSTADPISYAAVAGLLAGAAFVACYLPARRASRLDPNEAMRPD